jgi:hypothetical protein
MGVDISKTYMPEPVQNATTGAIQVAPYGTACPDSARSVLTTPWADGVGYVGADGITISGLIAAGDVIREWGLTPIRVAKGEAEPSITIPVMQLDEAFFKLMTSDDDVQVTEATSDTGEVIKVGFNGNVGQTKAWSFSMKDCNRRVRIFAPNASITETDDITAVPSDIMRISAKLSLNADTDGKFLYFIFDNGVVKTI